MKIKLKVPAASIRAAEEVATGPDVSPQQFDEASPYSVWTRWRDAKATGTMARVYGLTIEGSPARAKLGDESGFAETYRRRARPLPGMQPLVIERASTVGTRLAHLVFSAHHGSKDRRQYHAELWTLVLLDDAWRIWSFAEKAVSQSVHPRTLRPADFDAPALPAWFADERAAMLEKERTEIAAFKERVAAGRLARKEAEARSTEDSAAG